MRRIMRTTFIGALILFLAPSAAKPAPHANNLVDFSGTWQMDTSRSESVHFGGPVVSVTFKIRQTATQVSIETRQSGQSEILIYKLDGSESSRPVQANGPMSWSADWDGEKLVTHTTRYINGMPVVITETRRLDAKGKQMTLDRTLAVQHGYGSGQASSMAHDLFVKVL